MLASLALAFLLGPPIPITIHPDRVLREFRPREVFGAGIDGHERGENDRMLRPASTEKMRSAGLASLTYRLRTELGDETWHWNPDGTWSDPANHQGYWTSSSNADKKILLSYGYRLPRRGNSFDQANRNDYSRLVDGDLGTFWKSNPYLEAPFAQGMGAFPQWVVLDFKDRAAINCLKIDWGTLYAKSFRFEYWEGEDKPWGDGVWRPATSEPLGGTPGHQEVQVRPFRARYVRLVLLKSSTPAGSGDIRNRLGFAIREIGMGMLDAKGHYQDAVVHSKSNLTQTSAYVSSTDPWHRSSDLDPRTEQPGFDLILDRHLDSGLPVLMPAGCLFDTPENVVAELNWLKARGVPLRGLEIGEEPDGNWADPEHYAELYAQKSRAIRAVDTTVRLGGPSFQTVNTDFVEFPKPGDPWLTRFMETLRKRGDLKDFQFCTFEWYPVDQAADNPYPRLTRLPRQLDRTVERLSKLGMNGLPWMITEYGYSAFGSPVEADLPGAVFNMDVALRGLQLGAEATFLYGYEPGLPIQEVPGAWGNNMVLFEDDDEDIPMPTYWGAWLLTQKACSASGDHQLLETSCPSRDVGAYTVRGPSGTRLILCNRSPQAQKLSLSGGFGRRQAFAYDSTCYHWRASGKQGRPDRSKPPYRTVVDTRNVLLPAYALMVIDLSGSGF